MRVLFINRMLSLVRGGGETFDLEIGRHLARRGCRVSYLSGVPIFGGGRPPVIPEDFRPLPAFHAVRTPYLTWLPWDRIPGGWRLWLADRSWFERRALNWILPRQADYDIIQLCEMPDWPAKARAAGLKTPIVVRLTGPESVRRARNLHQADGLVASGVTLATIREHTGREGVNVPNAVDTDLFRPHKSDFRERHGLAGSTTLILYVARFHAFKNHELLLRAYAEFLKSVPDARLLLVGAGHLEKAARQLCERLGLAPHVLFLGEVPFTVLPDVYAAADIKVVSSDYESFCFAAIEAMSSGLPVVTTDCGWVPVLIGGRSAHLGGPAWTSGVGVEKSAEDLRLAPGGVITRPFEAKALARGLVLLAGDLQQRRAMGAWNRLQAVTEHGWAGSADRLYSLYEKLIPARAGVTAEAGKPA